tara:strand:+ start:260 stop:496 length:237 start_codon:yes stop_codon:yes gene_type:complete
MYNIYLESVTNNVAVYGMDTYTEMCLEDEDMQAMHDGHDRYPLWNKLHRAIEDRYPNSQVAVDTSSGCFKVIVFGAMA